MVIITLMLCVSAAAHDDEELAVLSELSDEELLAFLEDSDVNIPSTYDKDTDGIQFVRFIIGHIEEYGSLLITFSSRTVELFAEKIETAVLEHYGNYLATPYANVDSETNILQDNIIVDDWDSAYDTTNCYA